MEDIGLIHFDNLRQIPKQELLYFDKLSVPGLEGCIKTSYDKKSRSPEFLANLEYLVGEGLIFETTFKDPAEKIFYKLLEERQLCLEREELPGWMRSDKLKSCIDSITYTSEDLMHWTYDFMAYEHAISSSALKYEESSVNANYLLLKFLTVYLQEYFQQSSSPILSSYNMAFPQGKEHNFGDVVKVVLDTIPLPGEGTPLEEIIAFKKDNEAKRKLRALRLWMHDIATENFTPQIINDKTLHLLDEYSEYMRLQKLKFGSGFFENVIVTTLEIAENLVKINWSKIASSLFRVKHDKIALLEAELTAPGKEVAYLAMMRERF